MLVTHARQKEVPEALLRRRVQHGSGVVEELVDVSVEQRDRTAYVLSEGQGVAAKGSRRSLHLQVQIITTQSS